ncbi:unnamed protein product, partial [Ectocarpus sp. 4 AP-2014]
MLGGERERWRERERDSCPKTHSVYHHQRGEQPPEATGEGTGPGPCLTSGVSTLRGHLRGRCLNCRGDLACRPNIREVDIVYIDVSTQIPFVRRYLEATAGVSG